MHRCYATLWWWYAQQGIQGGPVLSAEMGSCPNFSLALRDLPQQESKNNTALKQDLTENQTTPQPKPVFQSQPKAKQEALDALYQEMLAFQGCPLSKTATHTVFGDGNIHSSLMLVGEAPGAEEDKMGKPFVGMSGKLLDAMLAAIGLSRSDVYITNILPWRPPFNRQPTSEEIALCLPFVERHIRIIAPKILLLVGSVACKALMRSTEGITLLQTKNLLYTQSLSANPKESLEIPAFAIYHPAYLLRSPNQKRVAWHQLLRLKKAL